MIIVMSKTIHHYHYRDPNAKDNSHRVLIIFVIVANLLILPPMAMIFLQKLAPKAHASLVEAIPILKIYPSLEPESNKSKRPNK
jgi:hypothetical protein